MSIYSIVNVPIRDPLRQITFTIEGDQIIFWNSKIGTETDLRKEGWRICDSWIGEHMFEPKNQVALREMYAKDLITALETGLRLGYGRARADIREALGIKS